MKKKIFNGLLFGGIAAASLATCASAFLTSCTTGNTTPAQNATMNLYNEYNDAVSKEIDNGTWFITDTNKSKVLSVVEKYEKQAQELQKSISKSGSVDEKIWIDSVVFQIGIEKASIETNAHYLGAPVGGNINTAYKNQVADYASRIGWSSNFEGWSGRIDRFTSATNAIITNYKKGVDEGVTLSGVMLKLLVSDTLQKLYGPQLTAYLKKGTPATAITSSNLINELGNSTYFSDYVNKIKPEKISEANRKTLLNKAQEADKLIDKYASYLVGEYWNGVKYGWSGVSGTAITNPFGLSVVVKSNVNEATNTYPVGASEENTIKGLGLTKADLDTKDIGIGFAPGKNNNQGGLNIYQNYLLLKNTTLYNSAAQVNELGRDNVKRIIDNMKGVDIYLAELLNDEGKMTGSNNSWKPTGYTYDSNIFDENPSIAFNPESGLASYDSKTKKWTVTDAQLKTFFQWLNCDQWFFGRDVATNQVVTLPKEVTGLATDLYYKANDNKTNPTTDITSITDTTNNGSEYSFNLDYVKELGSAKINDDTNNNFGDAGNLYQQYVVENKGIAPGKTNISGAQAYVGASFSMDSYNRWKQAVLPSVETIFVKSKNSSVNAPTSLNLQTKIVTGTGGAAYAGGDTFYLDVNPYYGLQKWSMTTLATHESLPGHNLQMIYAVDNTSSEYAPQLNYTSYAEGWGLFSEWLAVQYGSYGEPVKLENAADWLDASKRMQLPNFEDNTFDANNKIFSTVNINVHEANATMKNGEFMNGSYETSFDGKSTTDSNSLSQGYYNAMQYFGFLNERQLRAMRMVLDTSVHAGGMTIKNGVISGTDTSSVGTAKKGTGWSLQDEIDYMQANSGLGQGDITREAQRYLNYTAQATSYLSGEIVIEELYGKACAAYQQKNNKQFMDFSNLASTQDNTAPFFNLILRNNDIPLKVLEKYVTEYIKTNIGEIPPLNSSN